MRKPIYLDYAATTPVAPEVAAAMAGCLTLDGIFANPASRSHVYGWQAEEAVEQARLSVADLINADSREIVWTSGATESNNLALKGTALGRRRQGRHIVASVIEHKAVVDSVAWLAHQGFEVTWVKPDATGQVDPDTVRAALRDDTVLVSVMQVNNELGSISDVATIGAICRAADVAFHVDAAQSGGRLPIDVQAMQVDLLSLSAHKMYGPKGIGALYVRRDASWKPDPLIHGGGHEQGLRSGTLATHQCVGMGKAAEMALNNLQTEPVRIARQRDALWQGISHLPGVRLNGPVEHRACGHLNVAFGGQDGETLMLALADLAVSTGSACNSATMSPSFVLKGIGLSDELAHASLRFSLGRYTTDEEIDFAIGHISQVVNTLSKAAV